MSKVKSMHELMQEIEKVKCKRDMDLMYWTSSPVAQMMIKHDAEKRLAELDAQINVILAEFEQVLGAGC